MQRAAVSVPANIAEGFGRRRPRDKARFYNIAEASADELKHYLILARDPGFLSDFPRHANDLEEVRRMLRKLTDMTEAWADSGGPGW